MVAYSFKKLFVPAIEAGRKRHTIRAERKRHARPGEAVQLYYAMRTRQCRKILDPDPICSNVQTISLVVEPPGGLSEFGRLSRVRINGVPQLQQELERLAMLDGFDPRNLINPKIITDRLKVVNGHFLIRARYALIQMGAFWFETHGAGEFNGQIIHWKPSV